MAGAARAMAVAAAAGAVAIAILPHTGGLCQNILRRLPLPPALRDRLIEIAAQVLQGMRAFHHTGRFLGFAALTILIWVSDCAGTMIAGRALGLDLTFSMAMLLITGLGLGSALPSTPGYVGIYQFVAVTVLVPLGVAKSAALAFILVVQAYGYVVTLLLGLPCLWILRRKKQYEDRHAHAHIRPRRRLEARGLGVARRGAAAALRARHRIPRALLGPHRAPLSRTARAGSGISRSRTEQPAGAAGSVAGVRRGRADGGAAFRSKRRHRRGPFHGRTLAGVGGDSGTARSSPRWCWWTR